MPNDFPVDEPLYINEQSLDMNIRKYLTHLAALAKMPIVLSVRGRPQCISIEILNALSLQEQRLMSRREEICAHEMTDPHNVASIDMGRRELSNLVAAIALPLADNTWANEIHIDLQIGHGLPSPYAPDGMAVCIVFDCKHGEVRERFAPQIEQAAPAHEQDVALGMTVVVRPDKIGRPEMEDESARGFIMSLLQSDASLFRWTHYTLLILGSLQQTLESKFGEEQKSAMDQARTTLQAILLAIRVKRDQDTTINIAAADQQVAPITMPPIDQVMRALQSVKKISPRLGIAIQRLEQTLERLVPAVQAHATTHNQIASAEHDAAKQTMREPHPIHHAPHIHHEHGPEPEEH